MNNELPENFVFSSSSLQDWVDCRRRFQYRYLENAAYPAAITDDLKAFEEHTENGDRFHQLVHQHQIGLDEQILSQRITSDMLRQWWERYLATALDGLPDQRYPETSLSAPIGDYRLVAKYDLIAITPGERAVIMDWKTTLSRPKQTTLAARMQTVIYPYLLVEVGTYYNGGVPLQPEQITMIYWFANFPNQPQHFSYSQAQYEADRARLETLVAEVQAERDYLRVAEDERDHACRYCIYRSLCWNDVHAGAFNELDTDDATTSPLDIEIDLDQIAEIEF